MPDDPFMMNISRHVYDVKYRLPEESSVSDTWRRVARAVSQAESTDRDGWADRFEALLDGFRFLPGGRILAGAGSDRRVTLLNCFVMGTIDDSLRGIFTSLEEAALTMQQGGGTGFDFSTLRPRETVNRETGTIASGPVSFMRIWDAMCGTLLSTGARRGAMMATLRLDHPDILEFVTAKGTAGELRHFNLSVLVPDAFFVALDADDMWDLVFPADALDDSAGELTERIWSGRSAPVPCRIVRRLPARELWDAIMRNTYDHAEPGVLFLDRINERNNLGNHEQITATNPCGEIPLPPYGACNLGSINVTRFVTDPFSSGASIDLEGIADAAATATRFLDDVLDVSKFPLPAQAARAAATRRIGLGLTGLADALHMTGLDYDSDEARALGATIMERITHSAYKTSIELAMERGSFPDLDRAAFCEQPFIRSLPEEFGRRIAASGIRNSHLTAIAPAGTISLFANNISSGIEPIFAQQMKRRMIGADGQFTEFEAVDHAAALKNVIAPTADWPSPTCALDLHPRAHLAMQAAIAPFVDNAISKTINIPADFPFEEFRSVYRSAFDQGLKGVTTFRPNEITGSILEAGELPGSDTHCCTIDRESD